MTLARQLTLDVPGAGRRAVISDCGLFRYRLCDRWGGGPHVSWGLLNPSRATAEVDDPTLLRVMGFTRRLGFNAFDLWNPFAFRATHPEDLALAPDPIGPDNDSHIREAVQGAAFVVVGWGRGHLGTPGPSRGAARAGRSGAAAAGRAGRAVPRLRSGRQPATPADAPIRHAAGAVQGSLKNDSPHVPGAYFRGQPDIEGPSRQARAHATAVAEGKGRSHALNAQAA